MPVTPRNRIGLALALLGMWLLLGGCRQVEVVVSAESTPVTPTPSPRTTPSPRPTAVADPLPATATPSPTPTPTPTATPVPSATPSPSPTPCAAGTLLEATYASTLRGDESRAYRVWLPPCYRSDGPGYPTLYLLHGNTWGMEGWELLGFLDNAAALIADGALPPLIIVMPDGGWPSNFTSGGERSYGGIITEELIPHVDATYCTAADPAYRAVGGVSRGGYWSLEAAFRRPELFASVGGHSASLYDSAAGPDVNPQVTGVTHDLGALRIYLDIGENDWLIPNLRRLHEDLTAAGVAHVWQLNDGVHEDAYWERHSAEYLRWYGAPWPVARSAYPACRPAPTAIATAVATAIATAPAP